MTDHNRKDTPEPDLSPGAGAGSTHGGGAGSGFAINDESREQARVEDAAGDPVASEADAAPATTPAAAPHASRTRPASGTRGSGGGLGDAAGGARRTTAAEMTDRPHVGDVSIELPPGGSPTAGAAQGGGMSRGAADPHAPGSADPGAGTATTGAEADEPADRGSDASRSGLGDSPSGGRLQDFDAAINRTDGNER